MSGEAGGSKGVSALTPIHVYGGGGGGGAGSGAGGQVFYFADGRTYTEEQWHWRQLNLRLDRLERELTRARRLTRGRNR